MRRLPWLIAIVSMLTACALWSRGSSRFGSFNQFNVQPDLIVLFADQPNGFAKAHGWFVADNFSDGFLAADDFMCIRRSAHCYWARLRFSPGSGSFTFWLEQKPVPISDWGLDGIVAVNAEQCFDETWTFTFASKRVEYTSHWKLKPGSSCELTPSAQKATQFGHLGLYREALATVDPGYR